MGTRIYTVERRPAPAAAPPDAVFVKEGFCWPAALVAPLWLVWHRQWLGLVAYLAGVATILLLGRYLGDAAAGAAALGYQLLVGASANDWRRWRLAAAGYRTVRAVAAGSLEEAEARYFAGEPPAPAAPPPRPASWRHQSAAPLAPWSP